MAEHGYPGQGNFFMDVKVQCWPKLPAATPAASSPTSTSSAAIPTSPRRPGSSRAIFRSLNQSFTLELPPGFTYGTVWAHAKEVARQPTSSINAGAGR